MEPHCALTVIRIQKQQDMERDRCGSVSHPSKCDHGVYWPAADAIALACQLCNPDGMPTGQDPILPRSSGDTLGRDETRECCTHCGNIRTYFAPNCRHCGLPFPEDDSRGHAQGTANRRQPGACPECSGCVHYETEKKSIWQCADCATLYKAPKEKFNG